MVTVASSPVVVTSSDGAPTLVAGPHRLSLPDDAASWGSVISRVGPLDELEIDEVVVTIARPDLALHALVEILPLGGRLRLTLPNVAFADRVLALLAGRWPATSLCRYFTRDSASRLATSCGLTVRSIEDHAGHSESPNRVEGLLADRADLAASFTLHCERTHRGTIPRPTTFAPAVDYTSLLRRRGGTCHAHEVDLLDRHARVVEVAPASEMTHWLSDLGHRVTVVDRAVPSASRRWAERVVVGDLDVDDWSSSLRSAFDAVLLGNVIEHVVDPAAVLRSAVRCLDRSAAVEPRVVVSVPNVAHVDVRLALASGRWIYRDTGILDRTHLHFFTAERLRADADAAGLDVIEQRATHVPRGRSVNAVPWDRDAADVENSTAPSELLDMVDGDPDADMHVLTWALRPR